MPKPDDMTSKAAEFLKQWQEQMTKQMRDPDIIRTMLAAMQPFGAKAHDENARQPAPAMDAHGDAIRKLTRRVDALERELADLHAQLLSMDAKAKKPTGARRRSNAKPVAKPKRAVAKPKRTVAKQAKPAAKRKR